MINTGYEGPNGASPLNKPAPMASVTTRRDVKSLMFAVFATKKGVANPRPKTEVARSAKVLSSASFVFLTLRCEGLHPPRSALDEIRPQNRHERRLRIYFLTFLILATKA